jgi:hypothetical protein
MHLRPRPREVRVNFVAAQTDPGKVAIPRIGAPTTPADLKESVGLIRPSGFEQEAAVPGSTMLAIMGHMSRAMLERYSHIRMAAKSAAVEALSTMKKQPVSSEVPIRVPTTINPTGLQ